MLKKFNQIFHTKCAKKNCSDEIIGMIAVILSLTSFLVQFFFSEESMDVSSFSIVALCFALVAEGLFALQGYQKSSPTILVTRTGTFIGFLTFVILWILDRKKSTSTLPSQDES